MIDMSYQKSTCNAVLFIFIVLWCCTTYSTTTPNNPPGSFTYSFNSNLAGGMPMVPLTKWGDGLASRLSCVGTLEAMILGENNSIYFADSDHDVVRRISSDGIISQFAGSYGTGYIGNNTLATLTLLNDPKDIVKFGDDVFIADSGNHCIRKVNVITNIISDFVGECGGNSGYSGDDTQDSIRFNTPMGIVISENGRYMYISDTFNNRVRLFDMIYRNITTLVGDGNINSVAAKVSVGNPQGLLLEGNTLYVTESNVHQVTSVDLETRKMSLVTNTPDFFPTKLAKYGSQLYISSGTRKGIQVFDFSSGLISPFGVSGMTEPFAYLLDSNGNEIISEKMKLIYNRTSLSVIAGECATKYFVRNDGPTLANNTSLNIVTQIYVNKGTGELNYAFQTGFPFIHKYTDGVSSIIAGIGRSDSHSIPSYNDIQIVVDSPIGTGVIGLLGYNNLVYYANNTAVMKIDNGLISVIAGGFQFHNDVQYGGLASNSSLKLITSMLINDTKIFIASSSLYSIFTIDSNGILDVFLNNGLVGKYIMHMRIDPLDGNLVFFDSKICNIHKILSNMTVITLIGNSICNLSNEKTLTANSFTMLSSSTIDFFPNGDIAILERNNHCIRRWYRSSNIVSTVLGTTGTAGILVGPYTFSISNDNSMIVSDANNIIRKFTPSSCNTGWYGSNCLTPVLNAKFYSTVTFPNSEVKIVLTYLDSVKAYYKSATYNMQCTYNYNIAFNITTFSNPMTISVGKFSSIGNYSCYITVSVGADSFQVEFSNTLKVMEYENVMTESFLNTLSVGDVATIAANKDTYSKSSNASQVMELMAKTIITSQRNISNADETQKVTDALNVITGQSQITSTLLDSISNLVVNISQELNQLDSNTLKSSSSAYESSLSNVLFTYSNCFSSNNFNISTKSNSIISQIVMVATKTSSQVDSLLQVATSSFIVSVARNINQSIVTDGKTKIVTPNELSSLKDVSVGSVTFLNVEKLSSLFSGSLTNNYTYDTLIGLTGNSFVNLAKVTDLKYISNGQILKVANLSNPIELTFNVDNTTLQNIQSNSTLSISCKYFDETLLVWNTDGCTTVVDQSSGIVKCQCNHTTSFSTFLAYTATSSKPLSIAKIVVDSFLVVLTIITIAGLITTSKRNPTKSRWFLPYFALVSLIIELLFTGIIPSAMFLSGTIAESGTVQLVFTMISCVFYCLALLNYFMFNLRYITFRYVYELMAILNEKKEDQFNKFLKWTKFILTNNYFSLAWNALFTLFFIGYFIIFISLNGGGVLPTETYTKIMSSSVFAFVMTISLLVCAIYVVDIYMEFRYVQLNSKLKETNKKILLNPLKNYFIINDNLAFRKEFVIFFISIGFYVISNAMGFAYLDSTAPTSFKTNFLTVSYIFEVIYNLLLIICFGGLVSINSIYEYVVSKKNYTKQSRDEDFEDNQIKDILTHPILCQVFEQFAKTEHSLENLIFWKKLYPILENLNNGSVPSNEKLESEFNEWNTNFISNYSPMEINISHQVKKSFLSQLDSIKTGKIDKESLKETLKDIYCAVMVNLDDTFSRFSITSSYQQMNKLFELKEQMGSTLKLNQSNTSLQ